MLFGSMANLYYFNGDMAEVRIYRNRALTLDKQNQLGSELTTAYGVQNALFETTGAELSEGVVPVPSSPTFEPLPYEAAVWDADTLTGTGGSAVNAWASTNEAVSATLAAAGIGGATAPTLLTAAINGHNAVRFVGAQKSVLCIPAAQSPISGVTNFSVAFVLRTDAPGRTADQWYSSVGVIDAEQAGATYDWGIAFTGDGRVAGGIGSPDVTVFSKPFDLHDGLPHVAVMSFDALGGYTRVMVDGLSVCRSVGVHAAPRNVYRVLIGSLNALNGQYFSGNLAGFRFYPKQALTESEMTSLSAELAVKYGVRFVSYGNALNPQPTGLGSGDVEVQTGATLALPSATNAPVTMITGQTISGGGRVRGTLALAAGAAVDIGLPDALALDTLWLDDGAVVRWHHSGGAGSQLSVTSLKTSGTAIMEVEGGCELPARVSVISYSSGDNLGHTVWTVSGGKTHTRVEVNVAAQTIDLVTPKGTMLSLR